MKPKFANKPKAHLCNTIAVDGTGNVFVAGYDVLWINCYDGPDDALGNSGDQVLAIAVDSSGNVFVTGQSFSGVGQAGQGADYATIASFVDSPVRWTAQRQ